MFSAAIEGIDQDIWCNTAEHTCKLSDRKKGFSVIAFGIHPYERVSPIQEFWPSICHNPESLCEDMCQQRDMG